MSINVSNDELRTVRDAMRGLNQMIERLEAGDIEKFVLAKQHRMRAVVISVDHYTSLCSAVSQAGQPEIA